MRVAICAEGIDARYSLSRVTEEALLARGVMPVLSLFHAPMELVEAQRQKAAGFDIVVTAYARDESAIKSMCGRAMVIIVGSRRDGVAAFEMGAGYFVEAPATREKLDKALSRCLGAAARVSI